MSSSAESSLVGFPFAAVIGQDDFKLALLACAVDPSIGGVLATGERGTAKSTLARSFAELLPSLDGDRTAPFVELPLGATIDRLTGSVDTARLLAGEGAEIRPGLPAAADGGVLYADEVNLLGDHLVDLLLDAAAFGRIHVERDGISAVHDSRFVLVGTMNPEEGELRPQLLDRFGLSVTIAAPATASERSAIVTRRLAFERDPAGFAEGYASTQRALAEIVTNAREARAGVLLPEEQLELISRLCLHLDVEGMRGDVVTARAAVALAALDGRESVDERDVATGARLALAHRVSVSDAASARFGADEVAAAILALGNGDDTSPIEGSDAVRSLTPHTAAAARLSPELDLAPNNQPTPAAQRPGGDATPKPSEQTLPSPALPRIDTPRRGSAIGRGERTRGGERPAVDYTIASRESPADLDPLATARAAVTRKLVSGGSRVVTADDLRARVRAGREANLLLCVVDGSSSVLENGHAGDLRGMLTGLVADARRKRDRVGLIVFRGREARLVAPPTRNHAVALGAIESLEPGGTTPLAEGIRVAHQTALRELRRNPELRPVVVLITDGYANISRRGDAIGEARQAARALQRDKISLIVIGESTSGAPAFARSARCEFHPFDPPGSGRRAA
ncbi:MAG: VWA domain-containing protein [Actinobacteria bacterium]|nr:VWA domain-containing protein [Actinomycetota bacterium]